MKTPLRQATKQYFAQQTLSQHQIDGLQQKIREHDTGQGAQTSLTKDKTTLVGRKTNSWIAVAATAIFTMLVALFIHRPFDDPTQDIVREVVNNHVRQKPLEIVSQNFNQTSRYFTQLDFAPLPSKQLSTTQATMLGGRYCSIQSLTAAQLRYQDSQGKHLTLYQVGFDSQRFGDIPNVDIGESPHIHYLDGLKVSLWTEKGLLMVSVQTP